MNNKIRNAIYNIVGYALASTVIIGIIYGIGYIVSCLLWVIENIF